MKDKLKLGFIGGGVNSAVGNTHRIASQMDNRWELEAGCFSRNYEINLKTAEEYGVNKERIYKGWREFLNNEEKNLDAVSILTPTNLHSEMVITALDLGYAVICEKAIGACYQEAVDICKAVKNNDGFLAVTYNYTGYPMIRELRQMIKADKLGTINQIQIEMPQESFARLDKEGQKPKPQAWRLKDKKIPTVSLDLGVHLHNMIYFLTGENPLEVVADQTTFGHFEQVVDNVNCIARYTGGLRGQIWYSKSALGHRNGLRVRVYGDDGSAEWYQMEPEKLKVNDIKGKQRIIDRADNVLLADKSRYNRFKPGHPDGFIEAFANYYYDLADGLKDFKQNGEYESDFIFGCEHAKEGLKMLEAITSSAKNLSWVSID